MSAEENKALVRRYFEQAWNQRDVRVLDELLAPGYVNHSPFAPGLPTGPEGVPLVIQALTAAFPDLRFTLEDQLAEGDTVVTRRTLRGTHRGELMGIAPTGKPVVVAGINIERVVGGRIVEHWRQSDELGLLQQLGAMPAPGQGGG
jgi:predicted ester cyclase